MPQPLLSVASTWRRILKITHKNWGLRLKIGSDVTTCYINPIVQRKVASTSKKLSDLTFVGLLSSSEEALVLEKNKAKCSLFHQNQTFQGLDFH